jgi:hypothetical protein
VILVALPFVLQHPPSVETAEVSSLQQALPVEDDFLKVWAASRMGLYPVHLQRLPSHPSSISCSVGSGVFRNRA